jgi:hypothetical protein
MSTLAPAERLILAILREAQGAGQTPLLRTTLHKFVYLADVYMAEETAGRTYTGETWRFLHYGPFSSGIATALDRVEARGLVYCEHRELENKDAEYVLYSPRSGATETLRDIDVPGAVALKLAADLRRYARNLPALLDCVYFHTEPMEGAAPGDVLRFDRCVMTSIAEYKTIPMLPLSKAKIKRARESLRTRLRESVEARSAAGPIDEILLQGIAALEEEPLTTGLTGTVRIGPPSE